MRQIKYKLTDKNLQTFHGFQWEIGKWVKTTGVGRLCSGGWLHCYDSPLLAVLHNPIHANIRNPRLFEVEVRGKSESDNQMKCGYTEMRLIKEIPVPKITINQMVAYAIFCARSVYKDKQFIKWSNNWLAGRDRTKVAARSVEAAARSAARSAWSAAWSAAQSVEAAARAAAWSAARAAEAVEAVEAAAWPAAQSVEAAAWSAEAVDLEKLAERALEEIS